ncbi:hypothetical protein [Streptomyces sp. NPDC008150]|uniref:hypothetical protein n=1 Tax=Streptomyces sp. NPDC008150 TaxID=3364816 RepID=UPI0036E8F093
MKPNSLSDHQALLRYDQLAARVYSEPRMPSGTRDLLLALGWVTLRDPRRNQQDRQPIWVRAREAMNVDNKRMWRLVVDDVPRYEFPREPVRGCDAPMVRVDRTCGRTTMHGFSEFDPATGWARSWGFCNRPRCREYMRTVEARANDSHERAPEPIPNAGGLLPLFFSWEWEEKYRKAMELVRYTPSWEPPSYGLSADEWPEVPGQEKPKAFPKLRLVAAGGDIVTERAPEVLTSPETGRASVARSNLRAATRRAQISVVTLPRQTSPSKGDQVT